MNGVIGSMTVVLGGIITLNGQWDTQAIMAIGCLTLSLFLFTGKYTLNDVLDASEMPSITHIGRFPQGASQLRWVGMLPSSSPLCE